ncbi:MAG: diphthamide synthesis protein [archaeon]
MGKKNLVELEDQYDLELARIINNIKKSNSKLVLLQFPEGLKKYAIEIVDYLEEKTNAEFIIWFDTCFGACDTPVLSKELENKIDLIIQFGHNEIMPCY